MDDIKPRGVGFAPGQSLQKPKVVELGILPITKEYHIMFDTRHDVPLDFFWANKRYVLCPACVEGQEVRYCDGSTEYKFSHCAFHRDSLASGVEFSPTSELGQMLEEFRTAFMSGKIHIPVPGADVQIQAPVAADAPFRRWPEPRAPIYEHKSGCLRSSSPIYEVATASELEIFELYQEQAMADAEDCLLGTRPCAHHIATLQARAEIEASLPSPPTSSTSTERSTPSIDDSTTAPSPCSVHEAQRTTLASEDTSPALTKIIFFKRCTQTYHNALGYGLHGINETIPAHRKRISYARLLNRERMVQSGKATEENLIMTCWVWNRSEGKAEV